MRKIDFLSEFPRVFIFQQEIFKTNFGGVLFLIYIIIMLIISSSYILDFVINDKFEVEYLSINNQTKLEEMKTIDDSYDYNPIMEFIVSVPLDTYYGRLRLFFIDENNVTHVENLSEKYIYPSLKDYNLSDESIGLKFKSRVTGFKAELLYICQDKNYCEDNEKEDSIENEIIVMGFDPLFPKIDHQNPTKPILDEDKYSQYQIFYTEYPYHERSDFNWRVIQYKEKKGLSRIFDKLLDLKSDYFTGYLMLKEEDGASQNIFEIDGIFYRPLITVYIDNPHDIYDEYKRKRRTELDVLSTISALFTPIRLVFLIIYRFYAKKFNNYKIIENILSQKPRPKKLIELKNISEIKDSSIEDLNDNEKQEILIKSEIEEKPDDNNEES